MLNTPTFKQRCDIGPEVEVFMHIYHTTSLLAKAALDASERVALEIDVLLDLFDYSVDKTARFGVNIPRNGGMPTIEYHRWFSWWENYLVGLSTNEFHDLETAVKMRHDVSNWRPQGDWRQYEPTR
jgi:hypothetical protein